MKRTIILILLMLVTILPNYVYAEKSEKWIDLEIGLSSITSESLEDYDTGINYGLSLEIKHNDNINWIISANIDRFEIEDNISWEIKLNSLGFMGGAKYYFNNNEKSIRPYAGISTGIVYAEEEYRYKIMNEKGFEDTYLIGIKPNVGINFPVTDSFDFYFDLSYQFNIETESGIGSDKLFSEFKFLKTCFGFSIDI